LKKFRIAVLIVHFPGANVSGRTLSACPNAWRFRVRPGRATSNSGSSQILASLKSSWEPLPAPHNEHRSCETRRSGRLLPGFFGLIRLSLLCTRIAQNHNEVQRLTVMPLQGYWGRDWVPSRRSPGMRQGRFDGTHFKPPKVPDCPKGVRRLPPPQS
jgi:hypothetical protein